MDRINSAGVVLNGAGNRVRIGRNLQAGQAGTELDPLYDNNLQEELVGGIMGWAGVAPDPNSTVNIQQSLLLKFSAIVPNIAALRVAEGMYSPMSGILVLGYYSPGDGGGGNFVVGADATDNGGTIINDNSGRSWYRSYHGNHVHAGWWGYFPFGSRDIGQLFANVPQYSELFFRPGPYAMNSYATSAAVSTLLVRGNSTVWNASNAPTSGVAFDWSWPNTIISASAVDNNGNQYYDTSRLALSPIEGITIVMPSTSGANIGVRIGADSSDYFVWPRNFAVQCAGTGFELTGNSSFIVGGENLILKANGTNLVIAYGGDTNSGENVRMHRCYFGNAYVAGANITSVDVTFDGCSFDYNNVQLICTNASAKIINGAYIESNGNGPYPYTPAYWFELVNSLLIIDDTVEWFDGTVLAGNAPISQLYVLMDTLSIFDCDAIWSVHTSAPRDVPLCGNSSGSGTIPYATGKMRGRTAGTPSGGVANPGLAPMVSDNDNIFISYNMPATSLNPFVTKTGFSLSTALVYPGDTYSLTASGTVTGSLVLNCAVRQGQRINLQYSEQVVGGTLNNSSSMQIIWKDAQGNNINDQYFLLTKTSNGVYTKQAWCAVAPAGTVTASIEWEIVAGGTGSIYLSRMMGWIS